MKRVATLIVMLALGALLAQSAFAAGVVRISQVYGGGGGSTGYYNDDYIELFNSSGSAVVVPAGGWAMMYGSATGTSYGSASTNVALIPAGTSIPACGYLLIRCGTTGTNGLPLPVTPDLSTTGPNISNSTGKIALVNNQTVPGPACSGNVLGLEPSPIIDAVGWGPTSNCYETAVFGTATSSQQAVVRGAGGMTDNDNNSTDFSLVASPTPRNSASAPNPDCLVTPTRSNTWGQLKVLYR